MTAKVTAILLSWKRKANMPRIIAALRAQTVPVEIWLINNNGTENYGADKLIAIPWNAGEWARYPFAGRAETEYVMFQDDDFCLGDVRFLRDAIAYHDHYCPEHILCVSGRMMAHEPPHYRCDVADGHCHIPKGHFQLFKTAITRRARIPNHPSASDIQWALDLGDGQARHYVDAGLRGRMKELERYGVGYEFRPDHYEERDAVCAAWLAEQAHV